MEMMRRKLLVLCGTGGVGKTTISAAIAVKAAIAGKRVGLITIDPARRLATALGLESLGNDPQDITASLAKALGQKPRGSLHAMMLDSHATLHRFLRLTGGPEVEQRFRESELFQIISDNFGGAHDYLALEKLYDLHQSNAFDLIVLDTPPARHTLDFLHAPERIARFFSDAIFQWFLVDPRNNSLRERLRAGGTKAALSLLEKITGEGVIRDFVQLAPHIHSVKRAFVERQRAVLELLRSEAAGAAFVTSPTELPRGEAEPFLAEAERQGVAVLALIVNRSLQHLTGAERTPAKQAAAADPVLDIYRKLCILGEEEKRNAKELGDLHTRKLPVILVPEQSQDVHALDSLVTLAEQLD